MRTHRLAWKLAFALAAVPLALGCGSEKIVEEAPFALEVRSKDVALEAVDRVLVVLTPSELDRAFKDVAEGTTFDGTVTTRVSSTGQFVIDMSQGYIDEYAVPGSASQVGAAIFTLPVPLRTAAKANPDIADPKVSVEFYGDNYAIAEGSTTVPWPVEPGDSTALEVHCTVEFTNACVDTR
ncbi:MAG: hypothetical protein R3A78_14240 [Polyangiales bacterium]|nr:hypothetical protein [Myxococcales bacterium]